MDGDVIRACCTDHITTLGSHYNYCLYISNYFISKLYLFYSLVDKSIKYFSKSRDDIMLVIALHAHKDEHKRCYHND